MSSDDERSVRSDDEDNRSVRSGSGDDRSRSEADDKKKDPDHEEKKPKKKRTGPPRRMVLHEDDLTGKNGLVKLQEMFRNFSFRGKGNEKQDLDLMLHKYEQWTHVLFPKQPFAQVVERIEFLGLKRRSVKVHLKKIRMGMTGLDSERLGDDDNLLDDEIPPDFSTELEAQDRTQPESNATWNRLATQHLPQDNNDDEFPNDEDLLFDDNEDDIFASIDTGEGPMELLASNNTKPVVPPSSGTSSKTRSRHSSSSSSASSRSSTSSKGSRDIDDELLNRPPVPGSQNSISSSASSSITSSSVASSRRTSKAATDSPQSSRSSRSSVSVPRGKKKSTSQKSKGRLRAILEDSDSDTGSRATSSRKSVVSDVDEDSNDVVAPRKSASKRINTVNSSDDDDDEDLRLLSMDPGLSVTNNNSNTSAASPSTQQSTNAKKSYRRSRIVCSDSDDNDESPDTLLQRTETISISQPHDRDSSPAPSNASSESKGSKRKRSTKNIHDQTTLPITGSTQKSMMTSDQSDSSEADSRSGRSEKGKRPRIGSSDEESAAVPSPKSASRRRARLVSDSDED